MPVSYTRQHIKQFAKVLAKNDRRFHPRQWVIDGRSGSSGARKRCRFACDFGAAEVFVYADKLFERSPDTRARNRLVGGPATPHASEFSRLSQYSGMRGTYVRSSTCSISVQPVIDVLAKYGLLDKPFPAEEIISIAAIKPR